MSGKTRGRAPRDGEGGRGYPASEGSGDAGTAPDHGAGPGWAGGAAWAVSVCPFLSLHPHPALAEPPCSGMGVFVPRLFWKDRCFCTMQQPLFFPFPWNLKDLLSAPLPLHLRNISSFQIQAFPLEFPASHPTNLPGLLTDLFFSRCATKRVLFLPDTVLELPEPGPMCRPFQRGFPQISPNSQHRPSRASRGVGREVGEMLLGKDALPEGSLPSWCLDASIFPSLCSAFFCLSTIFLHFKKPVQTL